MNILIIHGKTSREVVIKLRPCIPHGMAKEKKMEVFKKNFRNPLKKKNDFQTT